MVDELSIPEPGGACSKCLSFCSSPPAGSADPVDAQIRAEIQLIGLISAIKGFAVTKPEMTVVELETKLKMILSFARSALDEDRQNALALTGGAQRRPVQRPVGHRVPR